MSRTGVSVVTLLALAGLSLAVRVPVSIVDFAFSPDSLVLNLGDSVVWTNNGAAIHTSTSGVGGVWDGLWDSGDLANGATFVREFAADGTFPYFCRHHPNMTGVVVVGATGVGATPGPGRGAYAITSSPNPFRARTTLGLAGKGPAAVQVFTASGRLVRTLPRARAPSVVWDGRDRFGLPVEPGVYFCRSGSATLAVTRLR